MNIVCLDLEGVLVPEIWIAFSEASGIPELRRTTRDEPDYDKLMRFRLDILREHGLGLKDIQATIATIDPLPGAKEFLDTLRSETQAIILSDTFTQFASPLMEKLGWPAIFWILGGGVSYTIGAVLYSIGKKKGKRYMHSVFHLFVLAGSILQFFAIFFYVL